MDAVNLGKKGYTLLQDNLDHPLVKEGLEKLKDFDAYSKLKDVDLGEAMNKFKDVTDNLDNAKKHASNVFKLF
jgi:hypothetical protein